MIEQAIYEPTTNTIVGIRANMLFQFNATTGAFIQQYMFTKDAQSPSCLATLGGNLYCGVANSKYIDWDAVSGSYFLNRDIFVVNAASFTLTSQFNWGNKLTNNAAGAAPPNGFRSLGVTASLLFGFLGNKHDSQGEIFTVTPSNLATFSALSGVSIDFEEMTDACYDPTNNLIWGCSGDAEEMWCIRPDYSLGASGNGPVSPYASGVCFNTAQNKAYFASGTGQIFMVTGAAAVAALVASPYGGNFAVTTLNTGQGNCNAWRIRSVNNLAGNPYNGFVLIPSLVDGNILKWNPQLDTAGSMVVLPGFTSPFDLVITPTNVFALQSGTTGLKALP